VARWAAPPLSEQFLLAVDRAALPAFDAFAPKGVVNRVKVIKRRAYGISSSTAFRDRVLLTCG
jgi:hypothetical protein